LKSVWIVVIVIGSVLSASCGAESVVSEDADKAFRATLDSLHREIGPFQASDSGWDSYPIRQSAEVRRWMAESCGFFAMYRDQLATVEMTDEDMFIVAEILRTLPVFAHAEWVRVSSQRYAAGLSSVEALAHAVFPAISERRDIYEQYESPVIRSAYLEVGAVLAQSESAWTGSDVRVGEIVETATEALLSGGTAAGYRTYTQAYGEESGARQLAPVALVCPDRQEALH